MRVMLDDMDLASVRNGLPDYEHAGGNREDLVIFSTVGQVLTFVPLGWVFKS
jgi:hypothetical protein